MTCEELRDEYDIYALGLDEEPERSEIRNHLRRDCPTCVPAVRKSLGLIAAMSALAPETDPPAHLRKRVVAAVNPKLLEKDAARGFGWSLVWGAGFVFLSVLAILLGVQARRLSELRRADNARLAEALAVLSAPDSRDVSFGNARTLPPRGRVVISGKQGLVLIASNLPSVDVGKAFELWMIPKGGKPIASGMFRAANGAALAVQPGTVPANLSAVAVTVEDESGVAAPTSTPIITAPTMAAGA